MVLSPNPNLEWGKYPSKLIVKLPKGASPGSYYVAVKQVYKGQEAGRETWMLCGQGKETTGGPIEV